MPFLLFRRGLCACLVVACWAAMMVHPVRSAAAEPQRPQLSAVYPAEHTPGYIGVQGDSLAKIVLRVTDEHGEELPGVEVLIRSVGLHSATTPGTLSLRTDRHGEARPGLLLSGEPGSYTLLASIAGSPDPALEVPLRVLRPSWLGYLCMGLVGGLALFLYGMRLIERALEKLAGARLREMLAAATRSHARSFLFGIASTLMVQSSSASTVLLVSFAGAGLVTSLSCLGATLGAALGSTVTVQLIAFRLSEFALLVIAAGFFLAMSRGTSRRIGGALLGFGLIFLGLQVMTESVSPLRDMPQVVGFFINMGEDPLPAVLVAALFTGIAQASSATIGIVLSLSFQGILSLEAALPFVLGANIGTATTAILASLAAPAEARRVAWGHAVFRTGGVLLILPFLPEFADVIRRLSPGIPRQIAHAHTLVNLVTAVVFFPLIGLTHRALVRFISDDPEDDADLFTTKSLDPRFHKQPSIAIASAIREVLRMGQLVTEMLDDVKRAFKTDDKELAASIRRRDDHVDHLDEEITRYLSTLSTEMLSDEQSRHVTDLLFITKDLELIADIISKGLVPGLLTKKRKDSLWFSDEGFQQIKEFHDGVRELMELSLSAIATWDRGLAQQVLDRKKALSLLERQFQVAHLRRLKAGNVDSLATTSVHVDAMNDLKRIVTHNARIAYAILGQVQHFGDDDLRRIQTDGSD